MIQRGIIVTTLIMPLLFLNLRVEAQISDYFSGDGINNQYWIDFIPHVRINDELEFYGDASFRVRDNADRKIITIRPSIKWQVGPILSVHGGVGFFYNMYDDLDNILEIRPWQGIRIGWPDIGPIQFKHTIRLEERYYPSIDNLLSYRGRYKIGAKIPLNKKVVQQNALFIPFAFEWLASADDRFETIWSSETRMTIGIGYIFSPKWQIEFEFMQWWTKELPSSYFEADERVFRLKLIRDGWVSGE